MGFMDTVFKKESGVDIEEFLNNLDVEEEAMYEDADAYVKPVTLARDADVELINQEVRKGNIILLNIADLAKRNSLKLRDYMNDIKSNVQQVDGDIARISTERVIITPAKVKIIKRQG